MTKAREFKASKQQRGDSSNAASTSSELSSDQMHTFEELSFGQPSTLNKPFSSGELSSGQSPTSELSTSLLDSSDLSEESIKELLCSHAQDWISSLSREDNVSIYDTSFGLGCITWSNSY